MTIIDIVNCKNNNEAREYERFWCSKLKATLNTYTSIFSSFDNEEFVASSNDKKIINKERTNFRQRKEREELFYLRSENKRLKMLLLEKMFNEKNKNRIIC
jgi:hypothetical protein